MESRLRTLLFGSVLWSSLSPASVPEKPSVTFGGFVDTYYAFDSNRPSPRDRTYGSPTAPMISACRHDEINIALAYLEGKISADRLRGRLGLQAGTSVHANYLAESSNSSPAAGTLVRQIQEATLGYRFADHWWIDAGIYLSHIGLESFISKDNWTYTRSMIGDFSPYYETGVKVTYQPSARWGFQLHVLNGWQNIYENNSNKAVGTQVTFAPDSDWSFSHNTFFGQETGTLWRFFNDFVAKWSITKDFGLSASFDLGLQRKPTSGASTWYGFAVFGRYQLTPKVALTARLERYSDPDRVIVQPADPTLSFSANSASVNVDYELVKNLLWRNEVRGYWADAPVFPKQTGSSSKSSVLGVTSLSYSF